MTSDFNAIDYALGLEAAGVSKEQAAVHARFLATAIGNTVVAGELAAVERRLLERIDQLEQRMVERNDQLERRMAERIEQVESRLEAALRLMQWAIAMIAALNVAILAKLMFL